MSDAEPLDVGPNRPLHLDALRSAIGSGEVPKLYANGFIGALGNADVTLLLQQNGSPVAVLNVSYTVAKTLQQRLGQLIERLERITGREIMTTEVISARLESGEGVRGDVAD